MEDSINTTNYPDKHNNQNRWSNAPIFAKIFFNVQNNSYEVFVMWFLLISTIVLVLSLVVADADDRLETERVL